MANPSNLYAEKIFAEHPSVLWALDDVANFVSYIPESVQDLTTWTVTNDDALTSFDNDSSPYPKNKDAATTFISGIAAGSPGDANTVSGLSATTFSSTTEDFVIGCWIYSYNSQITSIELGYKEGASAAVTQSETITKFNEWVFVSKRFTGSVTNANVVLEINYTTSSDGGEDYDFLINGLSVGYQSEEFNVNSVGVQPVALPSTISLDPVYAWTGTAENSKSTETNSYGVVRTNLHPNPSAGINVTGYAGSSMTISRSTLYSSSSVLGTCTSTGTNRYVDYSSRIAVTQGNTYTFSVYIYFPRDNAGSSTVRLQLYPHNGTSFGSATASADLVITRGSWTRMSVTATAGTVGGLPTTSMLPRVLITSSFASGNTMHLDNSLFEQSSTVEKYFDGSSTATKAIEALAYGGKDLSGYYIVDPDNALVAKNTGIPMAYGASGITRIVPNSSEGPSLIIPGLGFLNESGQNVDKTFEAWLRVNSNAVTPKRIMGPLNSTDGLYVNGAFLIFKIDKHTISHYVAEWFRPMLVNVCLTRNFATLMVNGEQVGSINFDTDSLTSVTANTKLDANDKDQDWLGFYAYTDVPSIDVDCIAIYPYLVNETVAKRRFVYGQGVRFPENLDVVYNGKSVLVDYPIANYSNNYNYPQIGKWKQGLVDGVITDNSYISVPNYSLPSVNLSTGEESDWLTDLHDAQDSLDSLGTFIRVRPDSGWSSVNSYLAFDSGNIITEPIKGIFGVFKRDGSSSSEQTLIKIQNKTNGNYFKVSINGTTLYYKVYVNGTATTLKTVTSVATSFSVGVDVDSLIANEDVDMSSIFKNPNYVSIFIGGDSLTASNSFDGNIYKIGFCSQKNFEKIGSSFTDGYITTTNATSILAHVPSYGLFFNTDMDVPELDVEVNSQWEDYVPLSTLGKFVNTTSGTQEYDLDFMQVNVSYPEMQIFDGTNYDTDNAMIKTYVAFKYLDEGVTASSTSYTTEALNKGMVVQPTSTWESKKFEVVSGSVVYPPTVFDESRTFQDVSIIVFVEFFVRGINRYPIRLKSLEISSKALDDNTTGDNTALNAIGTKLGTSVYPYKTVGGSLNYKESNPHTIYKGTSPYLYLTSNSGLRLSGAYDSGVDRGFLLKINDRSAPTFNISSMQVALLNNLETFTAASDILFEIKDKNGTIIFYIDSINSGNTRARIYAEQNGTAYTKIKYYWNGQLVNEPVMNVREWGMLGIVFTELLDFSSSPGTIKIKSPILFDLLSYYQLDASAQRLQLVQRTWFEVNYPSAADTMLYPLLEGANTYLEWDWEGSSTIFWNTLAYKTVESDTFIDPNSIYKTYIGTNKIVVDSNNSAGKIHSHEYSYSLYQNSQVQVTLLPEPA